MVGHARQQGDFFRGAQYMHWGGCDYLRENTWPRGNIVYNVLAAGKFASSAAHLLGKRIVGCECFGLAEPVGDRPAQPQVDERLPVRAGHQPA
jgi:hypothetical protein